MKRIFALAVMLCLMLTPLAYATQYMTEEEYLLYYEISDYLLSDWDASTYDLLLEICDDYDTDPETIYEFLLWAADMDYDHVWVPVHGGKKFHAHAECSGMEDPRPTYVDAALDYGFTPCKRCNP